MQGTQNKGSIKCLFVFYSFLTVYCTINNQVIGQFMRMCNANKGLFLLVNVSQDAVLFNSILKRWLYGVVFPRVRRSGAILSLNPHSPGAMAAYYFFYLQWLVFYLHGCILMNTLVVLPVSMSLLRPCSGWDWCSPDYIKTVITYRRVKFDVQSMELNLGVVGATAHTIFAISCLLSTSYTVVTQPCQYSCWSGSHTLSTSDNVCNVNV